MVARAYLENVWKYHGFSTEVVSNRDSRFTGRLFTDLYNYLRFQSTMSTACQLQTAGLTWRIHQMIEWYPGSSMHYEQNHWASTLAIAEYTYNNSKNSSPKISPFYANYGFEQRTNWPTEILFRNLVSEWYGYYLNPVDKSHQEWLEGSVEAMRKNYYNKLKMIKAIKNGKQVMLNGRNIGTMHQCLKLEDTMLGPFKVLLVGSNLRYCEA